MPGIVNRIVPWVAIMLCAVVACDSFPSQYELVSKFDGYKLQLDSTANAMEALFDKSNLLVVIAQGDGYYVSGYSGSIRIERSNPRLVSVQKELI